MPLIESFSGIRGIYDDGLDEQVAMRYCYCYLNFLKKKYGNRLKIAIGTDTRPSRKILKNAVIEVLDCDVIDLGIASTPMVEFGVRYYKADGGIIITASHNEPYWNGFKFLNKDGSILKPIDMDSIIENYNEIKNLDNKQFTLKYLNKNYKKIQLKKIYKKYQEINKKYSDFVLGFLSKKDKENIKKARLKVIIDPDGGAGIIAKPILEKLGAKVKGINMAYGVFNRLIEPNLNSLLYLANEVREKNYDFAAGFDCDADRVEIMTRKSLLSGNQLLALIADDILSKNKTIVVNNATSSMVKEIAEKHKAKYVETEVGETNVVGKMYKLKAAVGGEGSSSGVVIPPSKCRDGILTLVYLLKIIARKGKKIEELVRKLPEYYNVKRKVAISPEKFSKIKTKIKKYYFKKYDSKIKISKAESLKIDLGNKSFVWFRVSKTEANLLRIITDAPKKEQAYLIMKEALGLVKQDGRG